jgi:hypothetical protein
MVEGVTRKERTAADGQVLATTEIKFSSRLAALDKLARIQGMFKDRVELSDGDGLAAKLDARRVARMAVRASAPLNENAKPAGDIGRTEATPPTNKGQ